MSLHSHTVNIRVPQASILALLASAEAITLTPSAEQVAAITKNVKESVPTDVDDATIKEAVNRFLGWKLPKDFCPDAGISFAPHGNPECWPVGTNLFTADQAEQMFRHAFANVAATPPRLILNSADLPRRFLDAQGNPVESGSGAHVITHFHTAGLMFDVRDWQTVNSREQARAVATQCDLLGRKGDWVIGEDYEMQLIADRRFHEPAVDKKSFPRAPKSGLIYTNRETAWSSVYVWFVLLTDGGVVWSDDGNEGLAVPVLRVPPSQ